MERSGERDAERDREFSERLDQLKERGAMLLVVGRDGGEVSGRLCWNLLGATAEPRRRLIVFTDGERALEQRLPQVGATPGDTRIVSAATTRSAATVPAGDETAGVPVVELDDPDLADLGTTISEQVAWFRQRHRPLEPAELRFCLDSLSPLLDAHGEAATFGFVRLVAERIRGVDGMGHVHLPAAWDSPVARTFAEVFDVVVEGRVDADGQPQQRWHLREDGITSRWIPI